MNEFIQELRLGRAFAVEFDKFWKQNPEKVPPELLKAYMLLKQHYDYCISKELS